MGREGTRATSRWHPVRQRGFTLLEAMLTMVIIATGVTSMLVLLATGSVANADSAAITNAVQLAENIRELTVRLRFDDDLYPQFFPGKRRRVSLGTDLNLAAIDHDGIVLGLHLRL